MRNRPDTHSVGHVYVFIRQDLPLADQIVQVAHVCLEAGQAFGVPCHCPLVLLAVPDETALIRAVNVCRMVGIPSHTFTEPDAADESDVPMGLTAVCTPPLNSQQRRHLRRFPLWRSA